MKKLYIVTYKKTHYNPHITYPRNYNRYVGIRTFTNPDDAKSFAETVDVKSIRNEIGKIITL